MLQPRAVTTYLPAVNQILDEHLSLMDSKIDRATGEVANFNNEMVKLTMESKSWQNTAPKYRPIRSKREPISREKNTNNLDIYTCSYRIFIAKHTNDLYILYVKFNLILMYM